VIPVEIVPGIRGEQNGGGGKFKYDVFDTL
jgi:hypothetical protein